MARAPIILEVDRAHWCGRLPMNSLTGLTVFLSYRRGDTADQARTIADKLSAAFEDMHVFLDVASISSGVRFDEAIANAVEDAAVLLVLVGPRWAEYFGQPADVDEDYVYREIKSALDHRVPTIPVVVGGAALPSSDILPPDIRDFLKHQMLRLDYERFDQSIAELVATVARLTKSAPNVSEIILSVVESLGARKRIKTWPNVDLTSEKNIRNRARIPEEEVVLVLVDFTIFGNGSDGLALGKRGIYFRHSSVRIFINYRDLVRRGVKEDGLWQISIGRERLSVAGADRDEVIELLIRVRQRFEEYYNA